LISHLRGTVTRIYDDRIVVEVNNIGYDVYVPPSVASYAAERLNKEIELFIHSYIQGLATGTGKFSLIGFLNETDRDLFEKLISVPKLGPRAVLKALTIPTREIAEAIESGQVATLVGLPGIGSRTADNIVAQLKGKLYPILLSRTESVVSERPKRDEYVVEALAVLQQLGYGAREAQQMIDAARAGRSDVGSFQELLQEVYRNQAGNK